MLRNRWHDLFTNWALPTLNQQEAERKHLSSVCAAPEVSVVNEQQLQVNCSDSKHQHPCHNTTGSPPTQHINASRQPHTHTRLQSAAEICWTNSTGRGRGKDRTEIRIWCKGTQSETQRRAHQGTKYEAWNRDGVKINQSYGAVNDGGRDARLDGWKTGVEELVCKIWSCALWVWSQDIRCSLAPLLFIMLWPKCSYGNNELQSLWLSSMAITQINSPVPQLEIAMTWG